MTSLFAEPSARYPRSAVWSATGPMTIVMIFLHRLLPVRHRYSLPPREITVHLAERAGVHKKLDPDARAALSLVNHFGYGAMAATVWSLVEERIPVPAMAKNVRSLARSCGW
jgi:hypothetical protein